MFGTFFTVKNLKLKIWGGIFVIGMIILLNSLNFGNYEISILFNSNVNYLDPNQYSIYLEQSITKFRNIGSILSILGGFGLLITTNFKA